MPRTLRKALFAEYAVFAAQARPNEKMVVTLDLSGAGQIKLRLCDSTSGSERVRLTANSAAVCGESGSQLEGTQLIAQLRGFAESITANLPKGGRIELELRPRALCDCDHCDCRKACQLWPATMQAVLVAATRAGIRCDVRRSAEMERYIRFNLWR